MNRPRHRLRIWVAVALAAVGLAFAGTPGARAQQSTTSVPDAPQPPVDLSLVSQTTWVPLGQSFTLKLHIDNPTLADRPGAAIAVRVHESATSRNGFDDVIANRNLGGTLYVPPQVSVASLTPDAHHNVTVVFGLHNSGIRPTIEISHPGVYPVEVQLVNTGTASGSFVTWLVVVDTGSPKPIEKPLAVSFVWQAVADPILLPDGSNDPSVVEQLKPGGRLDRIATLFAHASGLRTSLVVGPETALAWKAVGQHTPAIAASFKRLRAAAMRPGTEVLPTTYVPIDAAELDASGLGQYLPGQYTQGAKALRVAFGASPASAPQSAFIDPAPTSDAVVNDLRQMLIDRVALRDEALIPVEHKFSPAQAFVVDTTGNDSRGVATAPFIEHLFNGPDSAALRAERVIAGLAEVAYETPANARGIVIAPPERWSPDLGVMDTVVSAVRTMPLVRSATLDDLFATISNEQALGADAQRRLVQADAAGTPVNATEYETTTNRLAQYGAVVGGRDSVVVNGQAALFRVLSTSITAERAHAELAKIDAEISAFTAGVTADEKRITLTSRRADVPLTFENDLKPARDVTVRVHLESAKLLFPKGSDQTQTLKPGSNTIKFTVEARASGTFPMTISVTSPNGGLPFGPPVLVTVRSAVFGGWAVGLTIAALVFLAGWWANHLRRSRRSRKLAEQPDPAPTST